MITLQRNPFWETTLTTGHPSRKATSQCKSKHKCIVFYPWQEVTPLVRPLFGCKRGGLTRGVPLYACANPARAFFRPVCKQTKRQPAVNQDRKIVRWHTEPYMNNNDNIGWLFFVGYKNILPSMLTILTESKTRVILLASRVIYSCIPRKRAIQYHINIGWPWGGYKNILPEMLTILAEAKTRVQVIVPIRQI